MVTSAVTSQPGEAGTTQKGLHKKVQNNQPLAVGVIVSSWGGRWKAPLAVRHWSNCSSTLCIFQQKPGDKFLPDEVVMGKNWSESLSLRTAVQDKFDHFQMIEAFLQLWGCFCSFDGRPVTFSRSSHGGAMLKKMAEKLLQTLFLYKVALSGLVWTLPRWRNFCLGKKLLVVSRAFHLGYRPHLMCDEADGKVNWQWNSWIRLFHFRRLSLTKLDQYDFLVSFSNCRIIVDEITTVGKKSSGRKSKCICKND